MAAFLTGRQQFPSDNYDNDDGWSDPSEQPTEPLTFSALLDMVQSQRDAIRRAQEEEHPIRLRLDCPLCCMKREEESDDLLFTEGIFLWPCDFHREQITHATSPEDLELYANLIDLAYDRYSWPPGY